jgi:hypothetical protein
VKIWEIWAEEAQMLSETEIETAILEAIVKMTAKSGEQWVSRAALLKRLNHKYKVTALSPAILKLREQCSVYACDREIGTRGREMPFYRLTAFSAPKGPKHVPPGRRVVVSISVPEIDRDRIAAAAKANRRSFSAEVATRLALSFGEVPSISENI